MKSLVAAAYLAAGAGGLVAAPASAASLPGTTHIGGQLFADLSRIEQRQDGQSVPPSGTGFDVKRAYLTVRHRFDATWSTELTTDAQYISSTAGSGYTNSASRNSGGVTSVFIKRLYLQAHLNDALVLSAGSYNLPWSGYVTGLLGYRYIESIQISRLGYTNGTDWGLNANGVLGAHQWFYYSAALVNGGGYRNPTRTRDMDVEVAAFARPLPWLNFGAGIYSGHLGQITASTAQLPSHTARRWNLLAAVAGPRLRLGAEYFDAKNYKAADPSTGVLSGPAGVVVATATAADADSAIASDEASGWSGWASYQLLPRWSAFARYDRARLSRQRDPGLVDRHYHLGVAFEPIAPLDLALVLKHDAVADGSVTISGGDGNASYTIGGTGLPGAGAHSSGDFQEVGFYTQFAF